MVKMEMKEMRCVDLRKHSGFMNDRGRYHDRLDEGGDGQSNDLIEDWFAILISFDPYHKTDYLKVQLSQHFMLRFS
jgi:hypothetical protein